MVADSLSLVLRKCQLLTRARCLLKIWTKRWIEIYHTKDYHVLKEYSILELDYFAGPVDSGYNYVKASRELIDQMM